MENGGDAGGSTNEDDLIDVAVVQTGGLHGRPAGLDGTLDEFISELLELGLAQGADQVFGYAVDRHDVREVDLRTVRAAQLNLGFFGSLLQALQGHGVLTEIESSVFVLELFYEPVDDDLVEVVATQVGITVR